MKKITNIDYYDPLIYSILYSFFIFLWWVAGKLGYTDFSGTSELGKLYSNKRGWSILIIFLIITICLRLAYKNKILSNHESFIYIFFACVLVMVGLLLAIYISNAGGFLLFLGLFFAQYANLIEK